VFTDARFVPFINCSNLIQLITEMFSKTQQNEWRKEIAPLFTHHGLSSHVIACSNGNHQHCIDMIVQMQVHALVQHSTSKE
jgi:hypothetical protein